MNTPEKDRNSKYLALQKHVGELEAVIIQRDNQLNELQHQLASARDQIRDMAKPVTQNVFPRGRWNK